ncbi:unnamed protein product, partial [Didymodactylos carnosus]
MCPRTSTHHNECHHVEDRPWCDWHHMASMAECQLNRRTHEIQPCSPWAAPSALLDLNG